MNLPSIKRAGRSGPYPVSDRKRYLLQLLTDPDRVGQFTVIRRVLSTAIERGALSLSKETPAGSPLVKKDRSLRRRDREFESPSLRRRVCDRGHKSFRISLDVEELFVFVMLVRDRDGENGERRALPNSICRSTGPIPQAFADGRTMVAGLRGSASLAGYCATKGGVRMEAPTHGRSGSALLDAR